MVYEFQFQFGTIDRADKQLIYQLIIEFQFQFGTIDSFKIFDNIYPIFEVSIPVWYDW